MKFLRYVSVSIALLATTSAYAQIEEITVTAQKREQALTDVSLSISAFTGDNLRSSGVENAKDVANLMSNVDIKGASLGDANPAITIRGVGMNNFNGNNNPAVGVYVDEVFLSSPALIGLAMMDVGRIEVLKGPQGTLYGRNASGGAINIISSKPTQDVQGFANLSIGDFEKTKFEGAIGGALSDTISGRVSALYDRQGESFHTNLLNGQDFGDSENTGLRGQLAYDSERLSWNLGVQFQGQDMSNSPFTNFGIIDPVTFGVCAPALSGRTDNTQCIDFLGYSDTSDSDPFTHEFQPSRMADLRIDSDVVSVNFNLVYDFDAVTLTSITGYIAQDRDFGENIWSTPNELFAVVHNEEIDQLSQEFRLSGDTERATWVAGLFYSVDNFDSLNTANSADIVGAFFGLDPLIWTTDQETTAIAAFASADWSLTDTMTLVTGLRFTSEEVDFAGGTDGILVGFGDVIPLTFVDTVFDDDAFSYRLALEYRPNDDSLWYGSVSTGFKSGGFFGDFTFDNSELTPFDSETVTAFEIGTKTTFAGGRAQFSGAAFLYDYEDIQTIVPSAIGFRLANMEGADIMGLDLELLALPTDNLDLRFSIGWLDTEVDTDPNGLQGSFNGNQLPNAPELQYTAGARYEIPVSSSWSLALQGDLKYTDEMFREATNFPVNFTDSYTVVNARASLLQTEGNWEVALWATNLFDEDYFQEAFSSADILGSLAKFPGEPRIWGLSVSYSMQ
jgi:iron complex outermembrane receptor protein